MAALLLQTRAELAADGWDHGPLSVLADLDSKEVPELPSRSTIARLFRDAGVVRPEPKKRPRSSFQRFVYPNPNACWQIDALNWRLADGSGVVIFQVTDDHSRLAIASLVAPGETGDAAVAVLSKGMQAFGIPQQVLSDNGVALNPVRRGQSSEMVDFLSRLGIKAITGRPYRPTTQGKNERAHQTLQRFLRARPPAASILELQLTVDEFDERFNTRRRHQALPDRMTPMDAWLATPRTPPPIPPESASTFRIADITGAVAVTGTRYLLGREHAGARITVLVEGERIDFFDPDGTHIRSHQRADKGVSYVGNNQPRTRRAKRPSTMS